MVAHTGSQVGVLEHCVNKCLLSGPSSVAVDADNCESLSVYIQVAMV